MFFPPIPAEGAFCRNPACDGEEFETVELSRRGTGLVLHRRAVPAAAAVHPAHRPFEPFALAAVELPEGLVVLGQVADGYGVADLRVGAEVELVVETLYTDDDGDRLIWRWKPVAELGEEADQ